jgi:hypothetical protein
MFNERFYISTKKRQKMKKMQDERMLFHVQFTFGMPVNDFNIMITPYVHKTNDSSTCVKEIMNSSHFLPCCCCSSCNSEGVAVVHLVSSAHAANMRPN